MKHAITTGVSFGLTSGVITTLGLVVGLYSSTRSRLAVLGGILIIAVADSLSDAMGIHMSEESENRHTPAQIWTATFATALSKLAVTMTFTVPFLLLQIATAVPVCVVWGLLLIAISSYWIGRHDAHPWKVVAEHLAVGAVVVAATHFLGEWISSAFE